MKFLFDLFPVAFFFVAIQIWDIFVATAVAIGATILQVGFLLARRKKVEPMLWASLAIILVFGGLTLYLRDKTFILWKPTVLYWLFGAVLAGAALLGRNRQIVPDLGGYTIEVLPTAHLPRIERLEGPRAGA